MSRTYDIHELLGDADVQQLLSDGQGGLDRFRGAGYLAQHSALLMPSATAGWGRRLVGV